MTKSKYIPHLAEFFFQPDFDWLTSTAAELYGSKNSDLTDRILYVDCINGMKTMPSESVDLIIADPPFGINFSGKLSQYNRISSNISDGYRDIPSEQYADFSRAWIHELPRLMKKHASAYIISGYTNLDYILNAIRESDLILMNHIIWHYQFGVFTKKKFSSSHYHILFLVKHPKQYFFNRIEHYSEDLWDIKRDYIKGKMKNGTKLPDELIRKMIDFSSRPGDLIFDPFMGNGTTAKVAYQNYRHYLGYEINMTMQTHHTMEGPAGKNYIPYSDRLPSAEELAARDASYLRAYKIFLRENKKS